MASDDLPDDTPIDGESDRTGNTAVAKKAVIDVLLVHHGESADPDAPADQQGLGDDGTGDVIAEPETTEHSFFKSVREWLIVIVIAITAAVVMKVFVVQQFYVSGHSMDTTLHDLDRVLVNKLSYDLHDPNRGDVVVLEEGTGQQERDLIKRVIALPGETIEIRDCVVYIDNQVLHEPYLDPSVTTPTNCGPKDFGPLLIGDEEVFVMGDNRPNSGDSRGGLGPVAYDKIVGRAFVVIWPKDDWQWL